MIDVLEFVLARLDEDQAWAKKCLAEDRSPRAWAALRSIVWSGLGHKIAPTRTQAHALHMAHHPPGRVLRDVAARRRLVQRITEAKKVDVRPALGEEREVVLRLLALPYADHPDYKKEWRI